MGEAYVVHQEFMMKHENMSKVFDLRRKNVYKVLNWNFCVR